MPFQITISFRGTETVRVFNSSKVAIGRAGGTEKPDLELFEDAGVSRQHAMLELRDGVSWIKDLGSRFGTQVNGREIRDQGECRLTPDDTTVVGETKLRITVVPADTSGQTALLVAAPIIAPPSSSKPTDLPSPASDSSRTPFPTPTPDVRILRTLDANEALAQPGREDSPEERRLKMLLDLPRQFSGQATSSELLQAVMNRVVEVIPAARRGALLLRNPHDDFLLLKAYVSADAPAVSETLARRAVAEKRAFIWRSAQGDDPTMSIREFSILSGMYAPVQWHDHVFGVICVDSSMAGDVFTEDDLQFLVAIGLYAGMALAEQQNLAAIKKNEKLTKNRLLQPIFPESPRAVLVEQAQSGKLRPGGSKSEASILFCDISGFTKRAARMDAQDVVEMLNHYFGPIIEVIFRFDGTVDKFIGDAVLAVFGCPQPDREQHVKAAKAAVIAIQDAVRATSELRSARGEETCAIRVGVHCGEVFHGFVGANDRLEFTVIGDAVNRACRLCDAAEDGEIVISQELFQRVYSIARTEKTRIQTKEGEMDAYRLKALRS